MRMVPEAAHFISLIKTSVIFPRHFPGPIDFLPNLGRSVGKRPIGPSRRRRFAEAKLPRSSALENRPDLRRARNRRGSIERLFSPVRRP